MIRIIKQDGWYLVARSGSHLQFKHDSKKGRVTISNHVQNGDLDHFLVNSILKQETISDLTGIRMHDLSDFISGKRKIRKNQVAKLMTGIRSLGKELLSSTL